MAKHRFPTSEVGRYLLLVLVIGRVVIDRGIDRRAGGTTGGGVQLPPALGMRDAPTLTAQPVGSALLAVLIARNDFEPALAEVTRLGELNRLAQHPGSPRPPVRHVPNGTRRASRPDIATRDHSGRIIEQD